MSWQTLHHFHFPNSRFMIPKIGITNLELAMLTASFYGLTLILTGLKLGIVNFNRVNL